MVNARCRECPSVLQAETIVVSCGLANFERTSWSTQRRPKFWRCHDELETEADCDMFVDSFEDNCPGVCNGRSICMIDCRKFDDPDCAKGLRTHIGRTPRIMRSIMESKNYHELHSRLYDAMSRSFSSKNIVIMICRSGRHRSVANAELRSNTLARRSRRQHSASLLHLSELDFWKNTCAGKCSECSEQSTRIFQTHYDRVRAECPRLASASDSVTERKRPRQENCSERSAGKNEFESSTCCEFARWRRSLLRKSERQVPRMFHKLLGAASDHLERVTTQSRKGLHVETTRNALRCSRPETMSEIPCSRSETLSERLCSRSETPSFAVKLEPASKTRPSRESLEQVADDDFRKQAT